MPRSAMCDTLEQSFPQLDVCADMMLDVWQEVGVQLQPPEVECDVTLGIDIASLDDPVLREQFEEEFVDDISTMMDVEPDRITIREIQAGSVSVRFVIEPSDDPHALPSADVASFFVAVATQSDLQLTIAGYSVANVTVTVAESPSIPGANSNCTEGNFLASGEVCIA